MNNKQKIIYGAGAMGKRAFEYFTKDSPDAVYCFADTFKGGTQYLGKPLIPFEEFLKIYAEYDVILAVYNVFELYPAFDKAGIYDFMVWDDNIPKRKEINQEYLGKLQKIRESQNMDSKEKIIYGAGYEGKKAFCYFGQENVYAFADKNKFGNDCLGKPVLQPEELVKLQDDYSIVICIREYDVAASYLKKLGVFKFEIWEVFEDIREHFIKNTCCQNFYHPDLAEEFKDMDFIEHPELITKYYSKFIENPRKLVLMLPAEKRSSWGDNRDIAENKLYGLCESLIEYAGRDMEIYEAPAVTHGYVCAEYVIERLFPNIIEPGYVNRENIHKKIKDCLHISAGPFFHYAQSFYSESEIVEKKRKQGRNLTAIPLHSLPYIVFGYDETEFVEIVLKEAKKFDSLTLCAHYNDYNTDTVRMLKANGAKIVSAGFINDPSFVKRLKTIMLLSDAVITNGMGSQTNYALSVDRPVKVIPQKINIRSFTFTPFNSMEEKQLLSLQSVLDTDDYRITKEQLDAYEPSTGFSKIRSREEMGAILDLSKRIIQGCDYRHSEYVNSIRKTYRALQKSDNPNDILQFKLMVEALPTDYDDYLKGLGL